jgi:hypothetical protein
MSAFAELLPSIDVCVCMPVVLFRHCNGHGFSRGDMMNKHGVGLKLCAVLIRVVLSKLAASKGLGRVFLLQYFQASTLASTC